MLEKFSSCVYETKFVFAQLRNNHPLPIFSGVCDEYYEFLFTLIIPHPSVLMLNVCIQNLVDRGTSKKFLDNETIFRQNCSIVTQLFMKCVIKCDLLLTHQAPTAK